MKNVRAFLIFSFGFCVALPQLSKDGKYKKKNKKEFLTLENLK